ncbi:MAG: hypothetical protein ABIA63_06780 [bacterium]
MTTAGWIIMCISMGIVTGLNIFCFYRILTERSPSKRHHGPLTVDKKENKSGQL